MLNCILHEFNNIWTITQQQQKTIDNGTDLVIEEKCVLFEEINKLSLGGSDGKESSCNAVDPGSIHESRRSPGERNVYPLQYTCLDNFMDRGDRQTTVGYSPWGCKKSNMTEESNIIGRTDAEAEAPIVWPSDAKKWLIGKVPDAGKMKAGREGDNRGWDVWMASLTPMYMSLSKLQELVMDKEAWQAAVHGVTKSQRWLTDWTELTWLCIKRRM